jgi:hypothetical protein
VLSGDARTELNDFVGDDMVAALGDRGVGLFATISRFSGDGAPRLSVIKSSSIASHWNGWMSTMAFGLTDFLLPFLGGTRP